ncbi:MAG: glycosyltransferase family 2 protein [Caulobacterales bacterium]
MVTLATPQRLVLAKRALEAFCAQTHATRELLIVTDPGAKAGLETMAAALGRDDIRIIEANRAAPLGALRNIARDNARGDVHCQWDDDDLHHPERLERQLAVLTARSAQAVCLQEVMQFFPAERALYRTNWRATEAGVFPGSLMCRANAPARYPETGPAARLGEDLDVVAQLRKGGRLHALADAPHLYVYVSHGANSWPDDHHRMLADRLAVSPGLLRRHEPQLRQGLMPFDFGPGVVTVRGPAGPAFTIDVED